VFDEMNASPLLEIHPSIREIRVCDKIPGGQGTSGSSSPQNKIDGIVVCDSVDGEGVAEREEEVEVKVLFPFVDDLALAFSRKDHALNPSQTRQGFPGSWTGVEPLIENIRKMEEERPSQRLASGEI
jgi:hypothetical protein